MRKIHHFISGQKQIGTSGRVHNVYDPSSGLVQAEVDLASLDEVNEAVTVAQEAALSWKESSLTQRTQIMFAFREILSARANELAKIISREHGKVISEK